MRNRNSSPAWVINVSALLTCITILLYLASKSGVMKSDKEDKERSEHYGADVKYIEFFSLRPSQLVYLDNTGYRLALDSEDEPSFIEARSDAIDSLTIEKLPPSRSNGTDGVSLTRAASDGLVNAYDEGEVKSDAERDESIDYNMAWVEFPQETERTSCDPKRPVKNVVLLKTHRAGGGTLANIIYRYGDLNDLEFALPKHGSYDFYWPLHFNPSFVDKQYLNSSSPNLLINVRYSPDTMTSFMPKDSYYIAMIRRPTDHFESVFNGYQLDMLLGIQNSSNPFDEFLSKPKQYLLEYLRKKPRLNIHLNMAKNGQIFDLGLQHKYYNDPVEINNHIEDLAEKINLVLIMEYFDESLILLKRELCWDLDDIVYFKFNQRAQEYKQTMITNEEKMQIKEWNNADAALYEFFNKTFWDKIARQDQTFFQEVRQLRQKVNELEAECIDSQETNQDTGEIDITLYEHASNFNKYLCEKMTLNEENYVTYLKKKFHTKVDGHHGYQRRLLDGMLNKTESREAR